MFFGLLGSGLLESAYEECLCYELSQRGIEFLRQVSLRVVYKGVRLDRGCRMDLVIERSVVVEIKAVERLIAVFDAQLLSYLRMSGKPIGLLINFHVPVLKNGIKRIRN